jgi:hypothetical protein
MLGFKEDSVPWILNHIDYFVSQSRGNERVQALSLRPNALNGHCDEVWDKVGSL